VLLISDLGRPTRFLNMLRVFRPSSPMSVGSWILAACGALSGASALFGFSKGLLGRFGDLSSYLAAVLGLPLAGYTGVLVANTAVPVWQGGRKALPVLFMGSAAASAGAFLELIAKREEGAAAARRFGTVGKAAELVAGFVYEREVGTVVERVARPLSEGVSGTLWKTARALTVASLGLSLLPGLAKWKRVAAGLTGLAGALALRFAVFHAGKASARDPRATFEQQRAGQGAEEITGPKFDQIPADYTVPYEGAYPEPG
jgi:formate-dependent nitrite reductase membrane component NrfD